MISRTDPVITIKCLILGFVLEILTTTPCA